MEILSLIQENRMPYDFNRIIDRHNTQSIKWNAYPTDVLPLWVADMDFESPPEVTEAIIARAQHGIFGYSCPPDDLIQVLVDRLECRYGWKVRPESIVFLGGVVAGFNVACHVFAEAGAGLMLFPPIYPPMLAAAENAGMVMQAVPLVSTEHGYELDWANIEQAITPETRILLLCSPHNPVGKAFTHQELDRLANLCLEHNLWVVSDEIHCDLLFSGVSHIPIASLNAEIASRTITLMAPSKTFNIPGLGCSFAIIENEAIRSRLEQANEGMLPHVNLMGYTAALAAYRHGQEWLVEVLAYLQENYRFMCEFIHANLPGIKVTPMQATYLAWLDCRQADLTPDPYHFFLANARVALNHGASFGDGGDGFVRLNFACPRQTLASALQRMKQALDEHRII